MEEVEEMTELEEDLDVSDQRELETRLEQEVVIVDLSMIFLDLSVIFWTYIENIVDFQTHPWTSQISWEVSF